MRARSMLTTGRLSLVVVFAASSAFALASCVIEFPTLTVAEGGASDASTSDATASDGSRTDGGAVTPRFCEGGSDPPSCDDFDDDNFVQDGAPVVGTSGCKPYVVGDDYLSSPRSLSLSMDASAGCQAFLGFVVPLSTNETIVVHAAFKLSDFSAASTPRTLLKIVSPDNETLSLQASANGLIANVSGTAVSPTSPQQPGGGNWFDVVIDARLAEGTFDIAVNQQPAFPNQNGIHAVKQSDAGADAGKPAGPVTLYFGTDRPAGGPDIAVHIDNITIQSQ